MMANNSKNPFSAGDSLVGYLYQLRIALLWSLQKLPAGGDFLVSVETLDDVAFESKGGTPQELVQTKHHRTREATLTNASPDFWKSLRIWFETAEAGQVMVGTALQLITTATAPDGSAASYLRSANRNVEAALSALETTAQSSSNKANESAYKAFLKATPARRLALLDAVVVIDAAPTIEDVEDMLRSAVFSAVERKYLGSFLERLEGWWIRRVLRQLVTSGDRILAEEIESQMSDLREQFKQDALPIDDDLLEFTLDEATHAAHSNSMFVRQMELTKARKLRIAAAIRDYYRAFEQRSRWLRDELVYVGEIHKYERRLIEEWELLFAAVADEIGENATEQIKERAAQEVLRWAEHSIIPIRPRVTEPFVTRGSLHMLADEKRVGWHPEFQVRLAELLTSAGGSK
jgi:hypothetical protein